MLHAKSRSASFSAERKEEYHIRTPQPLQVQLEPHEEPEQQLQFPQPPMIVEVGTGVMD